MALEDPSLTVDTTSTEGVGTYTLDDPASPGGGLRTLADAVADLDVADGDTVEYMVVDTTTEGAALNFERGVGTVGSSGSTLTRDTIRQSSNSGAAVSWPSGGSRTVRVSLDPLGVCRVANNLSDVDSADTAADNIGAARKNAANTFTQTQKMSATGTGVILDLTSDQSTGLVGTLRTNGVNSSAVPKIYSNFRTRVVDGTAGSEDSAIEFALQSAGAFVESHQLNADGSIDNVVSGNKYDAFPTGTKMVFQQTAAPSGWTKDTANNDAALRVVSGTVGTGGTRALSSAVVGSTTLSLSQTPSHQHTIFHSIASADAVGGGATIVTGRVLNVTGGDNQLTVAAGGGSGHDHPLALKYVDVIVATKD